MRNTGLDFDLNYPLPTSSILDVNLSLGSYVGLSHIQMNSSDMEPIDDEVIISSPRSFAAAREKARRRREVVEVHDVESTVQRSHSESTVMVFYRDNWPRRPSPERTIVTVDLVRCHGQNKNENLANVSKLPHQSVPRAPSPSFSCPVCMSNFVEETSTKCGHIFCKKCIESAIAAQKKCPTCRRKLRTKDTFRIYLPSCN